MRNQKHELNGIEGVPAIAMKYGIPVGTIKNRLARGLTIEEAVIKADQRFKNTGLFKKGISIRFPDRLPKLWCLALGMASH
ncbi:hypothetical protein [Vibrio sp. 10N.261.55.A7]|uniref:hypothetical protein n=1 Tax=Vibrio sp. 10N.261.55.A7 TaxID=1880851 RepID=UPI000C8324CE|nr:hypothetical protein [Vibrio sp. 10N.261.55.A7]PMJ92842.1 hypothetical protein BCU12_06785 [Vibrio sp. 10N.261.55.A7]